MRKSGLLIALAIFSGISTFSINAADEREGSAPVPRQANASPDSEVYRASEVIGLPVNDDKDQEVGQIKDLVINGASREVLYAVVALNDGKEKDAVYVMPWSVFQPHFGQGSALQYTVLTVPQTVWIQAPYWSVTQWRQASFSQWAPRVDQYFANHIHVNSNSNNRNTFRANKPVLRDDQRKDDQRKGDPNQDSPKPRTDGRSNDDQPRKPNDANDSSTGKPKAKNPEPPKSSGKQGNPPAEQPAAKNPKLPAPKNPDPADPKDPPTPRTEKPAPKNPK